MQNTNQNEFIDSSEFNKKKSLRYPESPLFASWVTLGHYLATMLLWGGLVYLLLKPIILDEVLLSGTSNFITYLILIIPMVFLFKNDLLNDTLSLKDTPSDIGRSTIYVPIMLGVSLFLGVFSNILLKALGYDTGDSANQAAINEMLSTPLSAVLIIISAVLIGPLVEELVFRKAIFKLVPHKIIALMVSSVLFGLIHVLGEKDIVLFFVNSIPYIGMGIFLGYVYIREKENVTKLYYIHALYNLSSFVLVFLSNLSLGE